MIVWRALQASSARHDPDRLRVGLHDLSAQQAAFRRADHRLVATLARPSATSRYLTDLFSCIGCFWSTSFRIIVSIATWYLIDFDKPT